MMLGFRVWDVENKSMSNRSFCMAEDGILYSFDEYCDAHKDIDLNRFIPMQSTGVKDWLGKPIYEGDMLFIHYHEKSLTNEYYLVNTVREFLLFYGARMLSIYKIANDGNVYEQPTLLEKLK